MQQPCVDALAGGFHRRVEDSERRVQQRVQHLVRQRVQQLCATTYILCADVCASSAAFVRVVPWVSTLIAPCGRRGVEDAEPELVDERAEFMCAKKAEPDRGVERGLSSVPESGRLAGGRFRVGTVRNWVSGVLTFLCFGGLLPIRILRGISKPDVPTGRGADCGFAMAPAAPGLHFVGSGLGGRSGVRPVSASTTRCPSSAAKLDSIERRCISAVAGLLMP
mmetsp:Transcript_37404/g.54910  ORF Transcript_37404/g.54910 Transcript_37404/m.54910 type:complete len:222 (-) Transcript_37404:1917-2582(-)